MEENRASDTAKWVTMGRALAEAHHSLPGFSDPFALKLLPEEHRRAVTAVLEGRLPRNLRQLRLRVIARFMERLLGPRTIEIDRSLREMPSGFQLVLMGAGLDARAYRLAELRDSIVFEVDHPASQALKRKQAEGLGPCARELRYVSVDFTRQRVATELERAGHSPSIPTAWVFEGVITYLSPREVEASIAAMASRSAVGSRILATYNLPRRRFLRFADRFLARTAEPPRSAFRPAEMRELLERHGFYVRSDRDGLERLRQLGVEPSLRDRVTRFHHVVIADRVGTS